ncbi:MAG: hypothetical protein QNK23_18020 [Crocinitomicaceae bacterium]|nr:hypothetical protein [Crocinitomicaceae bacterium]
MQKLLLSLGFLLLYTFPTFSQIMEGNVEGPDGMPIVSAQILDKNKRVITWTDSLGKFTLDQRKYRVFGISKRGYAERWYKVGEKYRNELYVTLDYKYQDLESVDVISQGPEEALDIYSVNIIDYLPFDSQILTLKKDKRTYYIGVDSIGYVGPRYAFREERPKSLFLDCMGNVHIVCNENVYQFVVLPDSLVIVDVVPKSVFDRFLEPCVAQFEGGIVMKQLSIHNQSYDLKLFNKDKSIRHFYHQVDEVSARIASEDALMAGLMRNEEILGDSLHENVLTTRRTLRKIHNGANPDIGMDFMKRNNQGARHAERIGLYRLRSYPINVRSFQLNDYVCVVDFEIDSVSLYNHDGDFVQQRSFGVIGDIKEVWKDHYTNSIYLYARNDGNHIVYFLDVLSGHTIFLQSMREFRFIESEKIHNGWLYYREIENGFFNINRVKLPVH